MYRRSFKEKSLQKQPHLEQFPSPTTSIKRRDAHDLDGAHKVLGQPGAFKGTVTQIFEERDGDLLILDFDKNYRMAMTAILRNADFPKFPDMRMLQDKELVVSG